MRRIKLFVLLPALFFACSKESNTPNGPPQRLYADIELRVHELVNEHRVSLGFDPLIWSDTIADEVRIHSDNMARGVTQFGHDGFSTRISTIAAQIPSGSWAENVATHGNESDPAASAVSLWLNSSGHKANIEGDYDMTGVGVARSEGGKYYFTQFFLR